MSKSPLENVLCSYRYDPMDKSIELTPAHQAGRQRFYCNNRLSSEIQGASKRSIFQHDSQILAQQHHRDDKIGIALLATDRQRSVLNALDASQPNPLAYTAYGHCPSEDGSRSLIGFTGEAPDQVTGHYHLGNGYRQYNPVVMRFNSPDSWSPFGKGGLNAYAYCGADPINRSDPSGHIPLSNIAAIIAGIGAVTTVVGYFTEPEVKLIGVGIMAAGAALMSLTTLTTPLLANRPNQLPLLVRQDSSRSGTNSPLLSKKLPSATTPSAPNTSTKHSRNTSKDQTGRISFNENVNSSTQSPAPLQTAPPTIGRSNSNYTNNLPTPSDRRQITQHPSFERDTGFFNQKRNAIRA
jgi:RHS repeat-associated protein